MNKRILLGRKAMRGALDVRRRAGIPYDVPICVYDLAEKLNISVWFQGGGSFGGMFSKTTNSIFVPSLRPAGRQAFTCGHEIGHWYYDHGSKLDTYIEEIKCDINDDDEFLADLFAGHLLMPIGAVQKAFSKRNIIPNSCSDTDFYKISCQLGVGYSTLLNHMRWTQQNLNKTNFDYLKQHTPKSIRANILQSKYDDPGHLIYTDNHWEHVPIDLQVGQLAIVPREVTTIGDGLQILNEIPEGLLVKATLPGIFKLESLTTSWASFVRVSRKEFEGRSIYRHLEEAENE